MILAIHDKRILVAVVSVLLATGFLATTLTSYFVSRQSLRAAIVDNELPLTSDNIYSEIQRDLIQPILISSVMATDTFVRDWVVAGEREPGRMIQYLRAIKNRYNAFTAFFVSDATRIYYHADGVLKTVHEEEPRDIWYFRVRKMAEPYEINVDPDMANQDTLTIFINYRVFDYANRFIGVTGIGLTVNAVRSLISDYQRRFGRTVYFVDNEGRMVLVGDSASVPEANIAERGQLSLTRPNWSRDETRSLEYMSADGTRLLNVRYISELGWWLLVEKDERGAMAQIRGTLYINILVCLAITAIVLLATWLAVGRFQTRLEAMATIDKLTGVATRHAFDILMDQALRDAKRLNQPLSVVIMDVDQFKAVNDRHGHVAGDRILRGVANAMRASVRSSDIVCRWGGDEFLAVLRNCDQAHAERIAEAVRQTVEGAGFAVDGRSIPVTVSLGVGRLLPDDAAEEVVARADAALYRAKQAGRNCVRGESEDAATTAFQPSHTS